MAPNSNSERITRRFCQEAKMIHLVWSHSRLIDMLRIADDPREIRISTGSKINLKKKRSTLVSLLVLDICWLRDQPGNTARTRACWSMATERNDHRPVIYFLAESAQIFTSPRTIYIIHHQQPLDLFGNLFLHLSLSLPHLSKWYNYSPKPAYSL